MKTTRVLSAALLLLALVGSAGAQEIKAKVSVIDGDENPAQSAAGLQRYYGGNIALDLNHRSLLLVFDQPETVTRLYLLSDPATNKGVAGNDNLRPDTLELYYSHDGDSFTKVPCKLAKLDSLSVILHEFQFEARYVKIHSACPPKNDYRFVNNLNKMVSTEIPPAILAELKANRLLATVTMMDSDTTPATTPGPGTIGGASIPAFDYRFRSIVIAFPEPTPLAKLILKADPATNNDRSDNRNLSANTLELYLQHKDKSFRKLDFTFNAPDKLTAVLDRITTDDGKPPTGTCFKLHYNQANPEYYFVNRLDKMVLPYGPADEKAGATAK